MNTIFFDIETAPLPEEHIRPLMPEFAAPANYKDPEKIKASIAEQQQKWLANGALSAITGRLIVVGFTDESGAYSTIFGDNNEALVLKDWWDYVQTQLGCGNCLIGFCCKSFDLPFLIRRSWALNVHVPRNIWEGRYFSSQIIDVAEKWQCSNGQTERISLDSLAKFLGVGAKTGDGKDFAVLWETNRPAAIEYLQNDLKLTQRCYERMMQ